MPPRRQSTNPPIKEDDSCLSHSLSQLSITNPNASNPPHHLSESSKPLHSTSRHSSISPRRRGSSRSPSHGRTSRASTPPLIRKASMNSLQSGNAAANNKPLSRRSSSTHVASPTNGRKSSFGATSVEEVKQPLTAVSVANSFFQAELDVHHGLDSTLHTDTVVILHDSVYGHRFSRPRTSRAALSTIVERPERIKASVLGVSMAYVRLGERHSEGAFAASPKTDVHQLPSIPFRIRKSSRRMPLASQAVTNVHGTKWMDELKYMCESAESILAMGGKELQRPEMERDEPADKLHEGDLYLCAESLDAMEGALGAVCDAVDTVFGPRPGPSRAFVGVRPPGHHCSAAHPSGFCWVNNVHVGIMHGILNHGLTHAAIIDFDLHHGDGSQAITWSHNSRAHFAPKSVAAWKKTSIGYFSLHDINSYPCEGGDEEKVKNASLCIDGAHGQSIWNVHLESWKTEQEFWELYETKYAVVLEKTLKYLRAQAERLKANNQVPKAAIFFSAGFDASEWESSGMQRHQVNVPTEFYARLTQDIVKIASEEGLGTDGRVISVLEGGYSDRALFSGTMSHLSGMVSDQTEAMQAESIGLGLGAEMGRRLGTIPADEALDVKAKPLKTGPSLHAYDPAWWSSPQLDRMEDVMANPQSPERKPRNNTPTYFSPTHASSARVTDPVKMRRSLSGLSSSVPRPRPVSPVAPEVPWAVAAHELSKLLIPSHRQTDSCKAEDLNAEATRLRRERQSHLMGIPPIPATPGDRPTSRMALRERRSKPVSAVDEEADQGRGKRGVSTPVRRAASRTRVKEDDAATPRANGRANGARTPSRPGSRSSSRTGSRRSSRRLSGTPGLSSPKREEPTVPVPPLPLEYESMASRPTTSGSSRPESAASNHGGNNGKLAVQKTRSRSATRNTPRTPRANKRATPPRVAKTVARPKPAAPLSHTGVPASEPANPSVDKITSGMKKIKINLITQKQKEAKEKAQQQMRASSEETRSSVEPQITIKACPDTETPRLGPSRAVTMDASPLQLAAAADGSFLNRTAMSSPADADATLSDIASPLVNKGQHQRAANAEQKAESAIPKVEVDDFVTYQPDGPEPVAASRNEPLKWLPPNIPTPSAMTPATTPHPNKNNGLFRYTSGIPFAPKDEPDVKVKGEPKTPE